MCQPVHDNDGRRMGVRGSNRDITEFRELQNQLMQSQKMEAVGRLAGGVAHDFNNLLTSICGNVSLARSELDRGHHLQELLTEAEVAASRATDLTRQLLAFSRKQLITLRTVETNAVIKGMLRVPADLPRRGELLLLHLQIRAPPDQVVDQAHARGHASGDP